MVRSAANHGPLSGPGQSPYDQGMEGAIAALGAVGLIVLAVLVLTILKETWEHVSAIIAPQKLAVIESRARRPRVKSKRGGRPRTSSLPEGRLDGTAT